MSIVDVGKSSFRSCLQRFIATCGKDHTQIAAEIGYSNPRILEFFASGVTRVPQDKLVPLARAVHADPAELIRLWITDYLPGLRELLALAGQPVPLSPAEISWLKGLQQTFPVEIPPFDPSLLRLIDSPMP